MRETGFSREFVMSFRVISGFSSANVSISISSITDVASGRPGILA